MTKRIIEYEQTLAFDTITAEGCAVLRKLDFRQFFPSVNIVDHIFFLNGENA